MFTYIVGVRFLHHIHGACLCIKVCIHLHCRCQIFAPHTWCASLHQSLYTLTLSVSDFCTTYMVRFSASKSVYTYIVGVRFLDHIHGACLCIKVCIHLHCRCQIFAPHTWCTSLHQSLYTLTLSVSDFCTTYMVRVSASKSVYTYIVGVRFLHHIHGALLCIKVKVDQVGYRRERVNGVIFRGVVSHWYAHHTRLGYVNQVLLLLWNIF